MDANQLDQAATMAALGPDLLLSALKYIGFGLTAVAAAWGLMHETTTKNEQGRPRLTRAGMVAIGLAVISAGLGASAQGLESRAEKRKAVAEQAEKTKVEYERRLQLATIASDQALNLARLDNAQQLRQVEASAAARELALKLDRDQALGRIEQTQRISLLSQPLRVLDFRIEFIGLDAEAAQVIRQGRQSVDEWWEGDDELKFVQGVYHGRYEQALRRRMVLYPLLAQLAGEPEARAALLVDLDGAGAAVLPIGLAEASDGTDRGRGFFENADELHCLLVDDNDCDAKTLWAKNSGCDFFSVDYVPGDRGLVLSGHVPAHCLATIIHTRSSSALTAMISPRLRGMVTAAVTGGFLVVNAHAERMREAVTPCWDYPDARPGKRAAAVRLTFWGNGLKAFAVSGVRRLGAPSEVRADVGPELEGDDTHHGSCLALI